MTISRYPMTPKGYDNLKIELRRLLNEVRPHIIQMINEARAHGDLSENAEYQAAKDQQAFNETRIVDLESKIASADIIDPKKLTGKIVRFGATVRLTDEDTGDTVTYQIVGVDEAKIENGLVSWTAPLARALIGKHEGERIEVKTPKGMRAYEILNVQFL